MRGTGPRATVKQMPSLHVGRGPVPRRVSVYRAIAGDRPPRYGAREVFVVQDRQILRRFTGVAGDPELQCARGAARCVRGTGPRATVM